MQTECVSFPGHTLKHPIFSRYFGVFLSSISLKKTSYTIFISVLERLIHHPPVFDQADNIAPFPDKIKPQLCLHGDQPENSFSALSFAAGNTICRRREKFSQNFSAPPGQGRKKRNG